MQLSEINIDIFGLIMVNVSRFCCCSNHKKYDETACRFSVSYKNQNSYATGGSWGAGQGVRRPGYSWGQELPKNHAKRGYTESLKIIENQEKLRKTKKTRKTKKKKKRKQRKIKKKLKLGKTKKTNKK